LVFGRDSENADFLRRNLALAPAAIAPPLKVKFKALEVISETQDEMVISLKGQNQRGLLFAATKCYMIRE